MAESLEPLTLRTFAAFNARDLDRLLELLHPDVRVRSLMTEAEGAEYAGHDGVRAWLAAVLEIFPDWCPTPHAITDLGDAVLVAFDVSATAAGSGVRIEQGYWCAASVRDGKMDFFGFFRSREEALAALGRE